jgi:hypothetical protein
MHTGNGSLQGGANFSLGLIQWHIVIIGTDLEEQGLTDDDVVCIIAGQIPVVDQTVPDRAGGPPAIGLPVDTWNFTRLGAIVRGDQALCSGLCSGFN